MMPPGGSDRARRFVMFAICGTIAGKTPEQIADEYMEAMGWNAPAPADHPKDECVCGDWRDQHQDNGGACLLNIAHPEEPCHGFQLYRRAKTEAR